MTTFAETGKDGSTETEEAIKRSISHTEITRVECSDPAALADWIEAEYDDAGHAREDNGDLDVWGTLGGKEFRVRLCKAARVFFLLEATYMWRDRAGMGGDYESREKWFETEQEARAAFEAFQEFHKEPVIPYMEGSISKADHQTAALFSYRFDQPFSQELERKDAEDERNLDCWQQPIAWN